MSSPSRKRTAVSSASHTASKKPRLTSKELIEQQTTCPVCFHSRTPIFQCPEGHIVCGECHAKLTTCPSCRKALGKIRVRALEALAESLMQPCKWQHNGCSKMFAEDADEELRALHQFWCEYTDRACVVDNCNFKGPTAAHKQHWVDAHHAIEQTSVNVKDLSTETKSFVALATGGSTLLVELSYSNSGNNQTLCIRGLGGPESYNLTLKCTVLDDTARKISQFEVLLISHHANQHTVKGSLSYALTTVKFQLK